MSATFDVEARSILTPTGGFLGAFTHTLNPYVGCAFGGHACGVACYASELRHGPHRELRWGSYLGRKSGAPELYAREAARERRLGRPLRVYMSSVTDPYVPQELKEPLTRRVLEAMAVQPPDLLVVQTHTPHAVRDADLFLRIEGAGGRVAVQVSVETDRDDLEFLGRHAYPVGRRFEALARLRAEGVAAVCVVAPLLPMRDVAAFAGRADEAADFAIVDHWRLGDGSPGGTRTGRPREHAPLPLPAALEAAGLGAWNDLSALERVRDALVEAMGSPRVGVSAEGFNRLARAVAAR